MASLDQLKEALYTTLENRGALADIKAKMRAEIFLALQQQQQTSVPPPPRPSNTNLLINELIREYLLFNHYVHTESVFIPEAQQPSTPVFNREFIMEQLNITDYTQGNSTHATIPLLYSIVAALQEHSETEQPSSFTPPISAAVSSTHQHQQHPSHPSEDNGLHMTSEQTRDAPQPLQFKRAV